MWEINHPRNHFRQTSKARLAEPSESRFLEMIAHSCGLFRFRRWTDIGEDDILRGKGGDFGMISRSCTKRVSDSCPSADRPVSLIFPIRLTPPRTDCPHLHYVDFTFKDRIKSNPIHFPRLRFIHFFNYLYLDQMQSAIFPFPFYFHQSIVLQQI